jgi:hypothetical protein
MAAGPLLASPKSKMPAMQRAFFISRVGFESFLKTQRNQRFFDLKNVCIRKYIHKIFSRNASRMVDKHYFE